MPFLISCNNKECGETLPAYLDPDTNQVFCAACDREISNVTIFAKNQMKFNKQFKKKEKEGFAVKCTFCPHEGRPILENDKILCAACKKEMSLTPTFSNMLKTQLKKVT